MNLENELQVFKFANNNIPTPYETIEKSDDKYIVWGDKSYYNLYHNYLLKLYSEVPTHGAIIDKKASMIVGNGLKYVNGTSCEVNVNPIDSIDDFIDKVVKDFTIFNAFTVEVQYNKWNQPVAYYFVPFHQIRMNTSNTKFWHKESWLNNTKQKIYDRWTYNNPNSNSKIFLYKAYKPGLSTVYPEPEYKSIIKSLETDIAIRDFNLNNIKNHFSVSTIISFFRGSNVSEEVKRKTIADLKSSYAGENGIKLIVDFLDSNADAKPADVKNISPNDWDKCYELIRGYVQEEIYQGHQVTSPILFGVKTPGQLGGNTELETSHSIFKDDYVVKKRNQLAIALNKLFSGFEPIKGKIEFADSRRFVAAMSEQSKLKYYTINELRELEGLPSLPQYDKLLPEIEKAAQQPVQPVQNANQFSKTYFELKEDDFDKIKDLGIGSEEFEFIADGKFVQSKEDFKRIELQFEQSQEIADYIIENGISGSIADLKKSLRKDLGINITSSDLKDTLKQLTDSGVINVSVSDNTIKSSPVKDEKPSRKIQVMYSYEVRAGMGEPIISTTRPFCKKVVDNNRLYTMEDIQTMSKIFGYDIFSYGGGFYRDADSGKVTPYCRHYFKSKTVVRK